MGRQLTYRGLILMLGALTLSCASSDTERVVPRGYARQAPSEEQVPDFEPILESVRLVSSTAFYRQADFWESPGLSLEDEKLDFWSDADSVSTFTESVSGTATIIGFSDDRFAAVTARHVVTFPDTVRSFYYDAGGRRIGIKTIAVRTRHDILLPNVEGARNLEVLASDETHDLALLGQEINTGNSPNLKLKMPIGNSADLEWGTTVYVTGFPAGMAMATSGLVSQPERDSDHGFLLDVVFNLGMSGAPVFARRKESSVYEWVGLVTSGSAGSEYLLVPSTNEAQRSIETGEPFEGDLFASRVKRLRYGITIAVSVESVRQLIKDNNGWLYLKGYRLTLDDQ